MKPFVTVSPFWLVSKAAVTIVAAAVLGYSVVTYRHTLPYFLSHYGVFTAVLLLLMLDSAYFLLFSVFRIEVRDDGVSFRSLTARTVVPMGCVSAFRPSYFRPRVAVLVHSAGALRFPCPFAGFHAFIRALVRLNPAVDVSDRLLPKKGSRGFQA